MSTKRSVFSAEFFHPQGVNHSKPPSHLDEAQPPPPKKRKTKKNPKKSKGPPPPSSKDQDVEEDSDNSGYDSDYDTLIPPAQKRKTDNMDRLVELVSRYMSATHVQKINMLWSSQGRQDLKLWKKIANQIIKRKKFSANSRTFADVAFLASKTPDKVKLKKISKKTGILTSILKHLNVSSPSKKESKAPDPSEQADQTESESESDSAADSDQEETNN